MRRFILGFLLGVIAAVPIVYYYCSGKKAKDETKGVTMLEAPVPFDMTRRFKVFHVLDAGALAHSSDNDKYNEFFGDPVVLFLFDGDNSLYDDKIIDVPKGKKVVQVGTFKYSNTIGNERTVPVLKVM